MKLPKMRRLMGLLARDMQRKQVKEMLAALPASCISQTEREDCKSAISFFVLLKKRTGTDEAFLSKLESVLTECNCADFLSRIQLYKVQNPDLFQEPPSQLSLPDGTRSGFKPRPGQSEKFRSILLRISRTVGKKQLEIMVGLSPTPEAGKQNISEGHELFEQMERHGCISENDTEMLQEMLELLSLKDTMKFLIEYHRDFPPILHDPPKPTAPQYASLSPSVQAQYGSLPEYGSQYPSQPQSLLPSQAQSLPSPSPSSSGHGGQVGPPSSISSSSRQPSYSSQPSSSNQQPSLGQGHSLSTTLSGGSSSFAPLSRSSSSSESHSAPAPLGGGLSSPYMESGEQNPSLSSQRKFIPGESPSLQHRSLAAAMRPFSQKGGSATPPPSHAPSLSGSGGTYPRPMAVARKRSHQGGAMPNGSLNHEESQSAPMSVLSMASGTYPRPLQEMQKAYQFPTSKVLNSREHARVSSQNLPKENDDDTTALSPPPFKMPRSSDQHVGDGGCISTQRKRGPSSSQGQPPPSSSASQAPETNRLSTLSSFTSESEKFEPAVPQGHNLNPGSSAAAISLSSLESYPANVSFPAGGEQAYSANVSQLQRPVHNVVPAASRPPPFNPHYPNHSTSAASFNPSYSSSINIPSGEQPHSTNFDPSLPRLECAAAGGLVSNASSSLSAYSGEVSLQLPAPVQAQSLRQRQSSSSSGPAGDSRSSSLGDQFRNAPPGFAEHARHHGDLIGLQQSFHHPYAGQSASIAGSSMPSLSNYQGHPSSNFAHAIQEQSGGNKVPPASDYKSTQFCEDENLANNFSTAIGEDIQVNKTLSNQNSAASETKTEKEYRVAIEDNNVEHNVERVTLLSRYQQQLSDFEKRYPNQGPQITEHGRNIAQASTERNVELRNTRSMQGALATAKEGEQALQQPTSSENLLFQRPGSNKLYPHLPSDTSTGTSTSFSTALVGSKRTREEGSSEERREEEQGATKKQKKHLSSDEGDPGLVSWIKAKVKGLKGLIYRNSSEHDNSDDQSQEEGCENAESETEYQSANEN